MSIKKEIFVTRKSFDTCIDITYGTDIFPIELRIADYVLPGSSIAVAYAIKQDKSGELKKSVCEISDNTIILNPKPGFFDLGKNMLQIRITASGKELYTYKGEVMCYGNIVSDDAKEVEDNPTLMEQILSTVGEIKEEVGTKQPLGSYVTTDDFDQEKSILNKSINDKVALEKEERIAAINAEEAERKREIAVERARIDAIAALPEGANSSDFALEDIKVKFNGETADTPGNAVREQVLYLDKKIDDETSRLSEDIVNLGENVCVVKPVENDGYLDFNGYIKKENFRYRYTDPIDIKKGETIRVTGYAIAENVSVIADYNNGEYSMPYVISDYTGIKTYEWVAVKDTQICVCYNKEHYNFVTITNKITNDLKHLELMPNGIEVGNLDFSFKGYIYKKGDMQENEYFLCTDFVPICKGVALRGTLKGNGGNLALYYFYDGDKKPLYGYVGTPIDGVYDYEEIVEKITDDNIKYVRCSCRVSEKGICNAYLTFSQKDYTDVSIKDLKQQLSEQDFYVGYGVDDGKNYFTSLVDCLWVVSKTDGKKVVHIANGTYDVLEELGGMNYVNSKNTTDNKWAEVQPVVNDCKIVGYGNVILTFNLDDSVLHENYWLFSCLNVRGNIELENIEIHSSNCRYAIHDESNSGFPNSKHIYKNVRAYQNVSVGSKGGQAIGCGFSVNAKVYINNCHFENGRNAEVWSCHANNGCSIVFDNTIFKNADGTHSVRISQNGRANLNARISNCYIDRGLSIRNEWADVSIEDTTKIELINTKIDNLINGYETIKEPVVSYNTIDGTITTLLDVTN